MEDLIPGWKDLKPAEQLSNLINILGIILGIITNILTSGILTPLFRLISNRRQEAKEALSKIKVTHIALLATTIAAFIHNRELTASLQAAWLFYVLLLATSIIAYLENKKRLVISKPEPSRGLAHANVNQRELLRFNRFEEIEKEDTKIFCAHINYPPLLHNNSGSPVGIGVRLLENIFGKNSIDTKGIGIHWKDIESALQKTKTEKGSVDLIATPLFQTRDRTQKVLFCAPLFFSEVGIYIAKEGDLHKRLKRRNPSLRAGEKLGFEEAILLLKKFASKLHVFVISGEISEKMIDSRLSEIPEDNIERFENSSALPVTRLVNSLVDEPKKSEILFVEVLQAGIAESVKNGSVINIMAPKQLLYPVSFAVRKDDLVLRNYINLKLLEFSKTQPYGTLGIIANGIFDNNNKDDFYNNKLLERLELDFIEEWKREWEEKNKKKWEDKLENVYKKKWAEEWAEKRKDKVEQVKAIEKYFVQTHAKASSQLVLKATS